MKRYCVVLLTLIFALSLLVIPSGAAELENLALGKPVTATSEYSAYYNMPAVNDGKMDTAWSEGSARLAPSDDQGNDWIQIDLGGRYDIISMIAYSRSDVNSASERMGWLYQVAESEDFSDGVTIGTKSAPGEPGQGYEVSLKKPVTGRYVRVACKEYFVIAEIEVYGTPASESEKGEYDDIDAEGKIYNASQMAYYLGIMDGVDTKEFGFGYIMTRGEAAEAAAKLQGSGELEPSATIYEDVPFDHPKAGYIAWCEKEGIVSKGTAYRPDDYITGVEFLTMLLRLNGWICLAYEGEYPGNIITTATKMKLLKGVDIDVKDNLNKSRAILLIYNMLITYTADPIIVDSKIIGYTAGDTYLEEVFDLDLYTGVVEETSQTGLVESNGAGDGHLTIDGSRYKDMSGRGSLFIGEKVYFLSDEDNNVMHLWRNPLIGTRETIMCRDIEKSSSGSISYYDKETDKVRKAGIASDVCFIKNGVASGSFSFDSINPANGKLVLIDNDLDNKADVIKLYEPRVIVVDYIGVDGTRLSIGGQNGESVDVPEFDELVVTRNGLGMNIGDIPAGSLAYAYVSDNGKHVEIEVSLESVEGVIESLSNEDVTIDGVTYEFSEYYKVNTAIIDKVRAGSQVSFLLDENGLVVWAINDGVTTTTETLCVVIAVAQGEGLEPYQMRVFNEKGEMLILNCAATVRVDGVKMGVSGVENLGKAYFVGKPAIYKLNSNGLIASINTDKSVEKLAKQTKWGLDSGSFRGAKGFYTIDYATNVAKMVLPVYEDFPVFTIPTLDEEGTQIVLDEAFNGNFSYGTINSLFPYVANEDKYSSGKFTFYGKADEDSPAFAIRLWQIGTDKSRRTLGVVNDPYSKNTMVVDSVAHCIAKNGEDAYKIYGYNAASGASIKVTVDPEITNVVDSYKVFIYRYNGQGDDTNKTYNLPDGIKGQLTGLGFIRDTAAISDEYITPIEDLKLGDILRYEISNEQVIALERAYSPYDPIATEHNDQIMTTGQSFSSVPRSAYRALCGDVMRVDNGIIEFSNGESYKYRETDIKNVVVVDTDNKVRAYDIANLPMCVGVGDRAFVVTIQGAPSYLVVYK